MRSPRPTKLVRLTKLHQDTLCKAYEHAEHKVLGGAPRVKETLVHFGYLVYIGQDKSGYEKHVLTQDGLDRAAPLVEARRALRLQVESKANERDQVKVKAALFDDLVDTMINPEIGAKTIDLPNGWRIRFDRSGPSKLVVQVLKQNPKT